MTGTVRSPSAAQGAAHLGDMWLSEEYDFGI